ncbi:putative very-long-chain (3R)-3-hydroxyacyl-[acyl-carrier protein] dehydratase [Leucoagaricus sp. SymC.cos]|nr:putative very-long-chain (3R)-3-hydroxyacyl-[acyl-carrier protein] dehydratase [Leucoagaricus sp. SymC.cos]
MSTKRPRAVPTPVKAYLIGYNVLSTIGWGYVLTSLLIHLLNLDGKSDAYHLAKNSASTAFARWLSHVPFFNVSSAQPLEVQFPNVLRPLCQRSQTAYLRVGTETAFVQSFAILEIAHVTLGWVRSPLPTTAAQVASRLFLVWGITEQFVETRSHPFYATMVFAWSLVEVIRYSFYAFNLAGSNPRILLWLRYTAFYVLYPLGASSEAFLIYASLPTSSPIPGWKSWLQGMWKPTDYIRAILFIIWWPGLYVMYTYMIAQRRKVLGSQGRKLKTK